MTPKLDALTTPRIENARKLHDKQYARRVARIARRQKEGAR